MNILILISLAAFVLTMLGGIAILKLKSSFYCYGFAAGSLIAVAMLDLLPESMELAKQAGVAEKTILLISVISFFGYSAVERFFLTHEFHSQEGHHVEHDHCGHGHITGSIGAGSLVLHSFFDGIAMGSAFLVSQKIGLIVALAVLFHDFTDGMNTVTLIMNNGHKEKKKQAFKFLLMDALAPILGVASIWFINLPKSALAIIMACFVGEFLYIASATLLPETRNRSPWGVMIPMAIGIALIAVSTMLIGG